MKIVTGGMVAVILAATVRSQSREMALLVSIGACIILCAAGTDFLKSIKSYLEKLHRAAELQDSALLPLTKACLICALSHFCGIFCKDAGEDAIGKIVELCGSAAAICAMLPLFDLIWDCVSDFLVVG